MVKPLCRIMTVTVCHALGIVAIVGIEQISSHAQELLLNGEHTKRQGQANRTDGANENALGKAIEITRNELDLAAEHLEKGDEARACMHLAKYVDAHPEHAVARTHYAELLLRIGRVEMARRQFDRFIRMTQNHEKQFRNDHIHCYRRLMEIAEIQDHPYDKHLNRGIALYLMARERIRFPDSDGELSVESLLFKSAGELSAARIMDINRARPCWYLHLAWSKLGQRHMAKRFLSRAQELAPFGELTDAEVRDLSLASIRIN